MHVVIIDGLNLIRRVHGAVQSTPVDPLDVDRLLTSCRASMVRLLRRDGFSHAACVMDAPPPSWRHHRFPAYKAERPPMPDALRDALPTVLAAFEDLGVHAIEKAGYEADDVIATMALRVVEAGTRVTIASTDKSFCQLLREGLSVFDHFSNRDRDAAWVAQRFEVEPDRLATLFALTGNTSVGVPGVRSVGLRTAAQLIKAHGDLEHILEAARTMEGHVGSRLRADREAALEAYELLSLKTDVELGVNLRDFRLAQPA